MPRRQPSRWAARFAGRRIEVAVEACTGWLFVCDALAAAGAVAHLAEPVQTRALRGHKRRAKTDREDARWLRELLADDRLPEAWIPPEHVRPWRSRARLRPEVLGVRGARLRMDPRQPARAGRRGQPVRIQPRRGLGGDVRPGQLSRRRVVGTPRCSADRRLARRGPQGRAHAVDWAADDHLPRSARTVRHPGARSGSGCTSTARRGPGCTGPRGRTTTCGSPPAPVA
jgi:hypothetical protein